MPDNIDNFEDTIRYKVMTLIHNPKYVIGCWWYRITDHKLEYLTDAVKGHGDPRFTLPKEEETDRYLEKGRLVNYEGRIILFIYSASAEPTTMTSEELEDVIRQIERVSGETILYVFNVRGENLLSENKKIKETIENLLANYLK